MASFSLCATKKRTMIAIAKAIVVVYSVCTSSSTTSDGSDGVRERKRFSRIEIAAVHLSFTLWFTFSLTSLTHTNKHTHIHTCSVFCNGLRFSLRLLAWLFVFSCCFFFFSSLLFSYTHIERENDAASDLNVSNWTKPFLSAFIPYIYVREQQSRLDHQHRQMSFFLYVARFGSFSSCMADALPFYFTLLACWREKDRERPSYVVLHTQSILCCVMFSLLSFRDYLLTLLPVIEYSISDERRERERGKLARASLLSSSAETLFSCYFSLLFTLRRRPEMGTLVKKRVQQAPRARSVFSYSHIRLK